MLEFHPSGNQTLSQREVDAQLRDVSMQPRGHNPRSLGIRTIEMMLAKNNGYPKPMYHQTLEVRYAMKEEEEISLSSLGYSTQYIAKQYPKALFRRNMEPKYEPQFDPATNLQTNLAFVQEITCRDEKHERELRLMKPKKGQSDWFERITDVPAMDDAPDEDPKVTIARLQGELEAYRGEQTQAESPVKRGRGRPRKEDTVSELVEA